MRKKALFDKNDKKVIKLLTSIGVTKNLAKVLVFFFKMRETISAQLERTLALRQPEVSLLLRKLEQRGWVAKTNIKKACKGRPTYAYRLALPPKKIIKKLELSKLKEIRKMEKNLGALKKLVT